MGPLGGGRGRQGHGRGSRCLAGRFAVTPQQPLQCDTGHAPILGFDHDQPGDIRGKLLTLRPLLDGGFGDRRTDFGSKLPIGQRDGLPGTEEVQEDREPLSDGSLFGSVSVLDR